MYDRTVILNAPRLTDKLALRPTRLRLNRQSRSYLPAGPDSREAKRRVRQRLTEHPSVIRRFAAPLDPLRRIEGETKAQRDARIKRERRQQQEQLQA